MNADDVTDVGASRPNCPTCYGNGCDNCGRGPRWAMPAPTSPSREERAESREWNRDYRAGTFNVGEVEVRRLVWENDQYINAIDHLEAENKALRKVKGCQRHAAQIERLESSRRDLRAIIARGREFHEEQHGKVLKAKEHGLERVVETLRRTREALAREHGVEDGVGHERSPEDPCAACDLLFGTAKGGSQS